MRRTKSLLLFKQFFLFCLFGGKREQCTFLWELRVVCNNSACRNQSLLYFIDLPAHSYLRRDDD